MKYCLAYYHSAFEKGVFDEVIIKYDKENVNVVPFAQEEAKDMRLILNMRDYEWDHDDDIKNALPIIQMLMNVHNDIAIMLNTEQTNFAQELIKLSIPFFYDKVAETWDELVSLVYAGVSDVYIGSELGFEIKDVSRVCHTHNVKVRVYPNVAQTSAPFKNVSTITAFFIRPEDVDLYEKYIDVMQFFGPKDRQRVLHQIYSKQSWPGKISDIIIGLESDINNSAIAPRFAEGRINCKKRCNQDRCSLCENVFIFGQAVEDSGHKFKEKRSPQYETDEE